MILMTCPFEQAYISPEQVQELHNQTKAKARALINDTQRIIDQEKLGPRRVWVLGKLGIEPGSGPRRNCLEAYMKALGWIKQDQTAMDWPLEHVPTNGADLQKLLLALGNFEADQRAQAP